MKESFPACSQPLQTQHWTVSLGDAMDKVSVIQSQEATKYHIQ